MRAATDLVAPMECLACRSPSDGEICVRCAERVRVVGANICARCGTPRPAAPCDACGDLGGFTTARSLVVFAEPSRSLALALKRRGRRGLARDMGSLLAGLVRREGLEPDAVTFVP